MSRTRGFRVLTQEEQARIGEVARDLQRILKAGAMIGRLEGAADFVDEIRAADEKLEKLHAAAMKRAVDALAECGTTAGEAFAIVSTHERWINPAMRIDNAAILLIGAAQSELRALDEYERTAADACEDFDPDADDDETPESRIEEDAEDEIEGDALKKWETTEDGARVYMTRDDEIAARNVEIMRGEPTRAEFEGTPGAAIPTMESAPNGGLDDEPTPDADDDERDEEPIELDAEPWKDPAEVETPRDDLRWREPEDKDA